MAAAANAKRKHSWWWDSHISPKNSKWMQENLSDMNVKVNQMLKLIEEDADSFARRAEMYYKKRPELKRMLEDFFREYRALAERYDHATVVLRHAHKTMSDAQLPLMMTDDPEFDFQTPEKNGAFTDDSDSVSGKKGLKQFNSSGVFGSSIRRGLNFQDSSEEKDGSSKFEAEIQKLKNDLAKLEAEKEATLIQYQQSMQKVSEFEAEVSRAQEESTKLNERAQEAEVTVQSLKELLSKLEGEKDVALEKVTELEKSISTAEIDAKEAEVEIETLRQDLVKIEAEKEAALEKIKGLEEELRIAEEEAKKLVERAMKAENEVERLMEALAKLTEEKDAVAFKCQQCLEKISDLESKLADELEKLRLAEERCLLLETTNETMNTELVEKQKELGNLWTCIQEERLRFVEAETAFQTLQHLHSHSQEELRSLAAQLDNTNQILKEMEDRNQTLHDEVEKVSEQNKNLNESSSLTINGLQVEISSLRETIQKLEQEIELRVDQRNALQQEIYCLKEELNDLNKRNRGLLDQVDSVGLDPDSFGQSVKDLQDEHSKLKEMCKRETIEKAALLEKLVIMEELIQKNILLENSLSDLNVELEGVRDRVKMLEESYESLAMEKAAQKDALVSELQGLTEKVEKLAEKNGVLENFLSNANAEVEELRFKSISLEESKTGLETEKVSLMSQLGVTRQNLEDLERRYKELEEVRVFVEKEKDSLVSQLQMMSEKVDKLAEKNGFLENSLSDSNLQVEELRVKSKTLEESCELLRNEKTGLEAELAIVTSQLGLAQQNLADLEKRYAELEEIRVFVEKEKDSVLLEMKRLRDELDEERHKNLDLESQILLLQQQVVCMNSDYGDELDKNSIFQVEIFVLQKCMQDLKDRIASLESDRKARKLRISALENQNLEHQVKLKSLTSGLYQMLKVLDVNGKNGFGRFFEKDQNPIEHIIWKMKDLQNSLSKAQDENLQAAIEKSVAETLVREMELEAADLCTERNKLDQHHKDKSEQLIILQREFEDMTEKLALEVLEGLCREDVLRSELQILYEYLVSLKDEHSAVCEEKRCLMDDFLQLKEEKSKLEEENRVLFGETLSLKDEHSAVCEEKRCLMDDFSQLKEEKWTLEEENHVLFGETLSLSTSSVVLEHNAVQRSLELKELTKCREELNLVSNDLRDKLTTVERSLEKSEQELASVKSVNLRLNSEVANGKEMLNRLESEKEAAQKEMEVKLLKLLKENEEHVIREESLSNDVEKWEAEAAALLGKLIISEVRELLLEEKLLEVNEASHSSSAIKAAQIEALEKKVGTLEGENGELNGKVAAYVSALFSLEECVSSLENSFGLDNKETKADDEEIKDVGLMSHKPTDSHPEESTEEIVIPIVPGSETHDLPMRLRAIEKALLVKTQERDNLSSKLVSAMEEINNLKSKPSPHPENTDRALVDGLTKDIVLDQISETSSFVALSRRATMEDDQMLELWEDHPRKSSEIETEPKKEHRSLNPSAESLSVSGIGGGGKKKVLERLDSDVQKLTNLQITVEDLKRKVGSTEKTVKVKGVEYDLLKGQLEEAEASILKLFDSNRELVKNIESGDEGGNVSRRRVSEQARRGSEKIGRLQLELQKIQFLLLKLDGGKELGKDKSARLMTDRSARVLLQDYLYGSSRKNNQVPKKKKATFCGCAPKVVD